MANGSWILELADKSWAELDADEKEVFQSWLKTAKGHDLYIAIRVDRRRRKRSSVQTLKAVTGGKGLDDE